MQVVLHTRDKGNVKERLTTATTSLKSIVGKEKAEFYQVESQFEQIQDNNRQSVEKAKALDTVVGNLQKAAFLIQDAVSALYTLDNREV